MNGLATTVQFQYGLTTAYGSNIAFSGAHGCSASREHMLSGLTPAATYHFRLTATNGLGGTSRLDRTFPRPLRLSWGLAITARRQLAQGDVDSYTITVTNLGTAASPAPSP
jgi:hypothetical protein